MHLLILVLYRSFACLPTCLFLQLAIFCLASFVFFIIYFIFIFSFKNNPTLFPGRMSKKATKPGSVVYVFILCYRFLFVFFVSDEWFLLLDLGICISLGLLYILVAASPVFDFVFLELANRLAGKSMTY